MNVHKFYGSTTREALRQVRDALGPDALILSNRQVAGGRVEIIAVADADMASLTSLPTSAPAAPRATPPANPPSTPRATAVNRTYAIPLDEDEAPATSSSPAFVVRPNRAVGEPQTPAARTLHEALLNPKMGLQSEPRPAPKPAPIFSLEPEPEPQPKPSLHSYDFDIPSLSDAALEASAAPKEPELKQEINSIMQELKFLRSLVEGQLAGFAWNEMQQMEPTRLDLFRRMLATGFSPALTRQILKHLPAEHDQETAIKWISTALLHNLPSIGMPGDIVDTGGIFALVGPTGVGKTTTVAKLAARCTLKHGPSRVALVTTDSYRIGAHDQLRIYGKILGVAVHAVKDEADLQLLLADLADRHLVLIDTVGMGQRDRRVEEQIAMLCGNGKAVRRLLLMSATAQGTQLDDVVQRYQGQGLDGVILTKVDEATQFAAALDVIIRRKLTLHYVTNGQRVPEDLHLANPLYLIDRALKAVVQGPHQLKDEEYALYSAAMSNPLDGVITKRRATRGGGRG